MIYGNEQSINLLQGLLKSAIDGNPIRFSFLMLHGPSSLGKMTSIEQALHDYTKRFPQDVLYIKDCSEFVEQWRHPLRAKLSKSDPLRIIRTGKDKFYENKDTREIISRLSTSSLGPVKFVVIENAERMTTVAQNTLLKTLEEPLPGRCIVATTSHKNLLLDTLHSRAFHIGFELLSHADLMSFMSSLSVPSWVSQDTLVHFSLWRPWLIQKLLSKPEVFGELLTIYNELTQYLLRSGNYQKKLQALLKSDELWFLDHMIVALQQYCIDSGFFEQNQRLLQLQRDLAISIKPDQLIFGAVI